MNLSLPEFFIVQNWPLSPSSYCFLCKQLLKPDDQYRMHRIDCRHQVYKKNNKRLKANTHITLKVHQECP